MMDFSAIHLTRNVPNSFNFQRLLSQAKEEYDFANYSGVMVNSGEVVRRVHRLSVPRGFRFTQMLPCWRASINFIEGASQKIRRQIEELERVSGVVSSSLTVDGVPFDSYLTRVVWDEAKYPTMSPLKEIVDGIHVQIAKIEDDMKIHGRECWFMT